MISRRAQDHMRGTKSVSSIGIKNPEATLILSFFLATMSGRALQEMARLSSFAL
jgi:hypothetical protein